MQLIKLIYISNQNLMMSKLTNRFQYQSQELK